jgi:hypothetical protein
MLYLSLRREKKGELPRDLIVIKLASPVGSDLGNVSKFVLYLLSSHILCKLVCLPGIHTLDLQKVPARLNLIYRQPTRFYTIKNGNDHF